MKNRLKQRLCASEVVIGAQLRFGVPAIAELFGKAGFDYVVFDTEHAPQPPIGVQAQLQGLASSEATPIVRVPNNDPDVIRLYLDMGAGGVLVPFVNSAEEAHCAAEVCRYPPQGTRGYGPARASGFGFDTDYFDEANDNVVCLVIIETAQAVANIDEIFAVEGVDSYIVGPFDLSISLGIPRECEHPRFKEAVETVLAAAHNAGKPPGTDVDAIPCTSETFDAPIRDGYKMLLVDGDEWMLHAACKNVIECCEQSKDSLKS